MASFSGRQRIRSSTTIEESARTEWKTLQTLRGTFEISAEAWARPRRH
jgi:hypothetical protein